MFITWKHKERNEILNESTIDDLVNFLNLLSERKMMPTLNKLLRSN